MCDEKATVSAPPVEKVEQPQHINLSLGSGLVIVGIWTMSTCFTVFLLVLTLTDILVNNTEALKDFNPSDFAVLFIFAFFLLITSIPSIVAYKVTAIILGKEN